MKLNETEKMIQQQLKKELSIPDSVHDSLQEAYRKIENKEVLQKKPAGGKRWQKRAVKIGRYGSGAGGRLCSAYPIRQRPKICPGSAICLKGWKVRSVFPGIFPKGRGSGRRRVNGFFSGT